ncbi:MAG: hypothetical protein JXQ29_00425 [Planctomycetes bacterium]|nr:hypothetical protein [Planctomycetota bacterium]
MPFCPRCREEYDASVARCAECGAELVASLDAASAAAGSREARILVEDEQVGRSLVDALLVEGLQVNLDADKHPWRDRMVPAVVVPADLQEFVAVLVTRSDRFQVVETDEQGRGLVGFFDPTSLAALRRHPLIRRKPKDIAAMGEAVIPELVELLAAGEPEIRRWASRRLLDQGAAGATALRGALFSGVSQGDRDLVFTAIRALDEAEAGGVPVDRSVPAAVRGALTAEDPSARALGCLVLGRFGARDDVARLIPLLADPEPLVLEEAVEAIEALTGVALGLHAGCTAEEREREVARLRDALTREGGDG